MLFLLLSTITTFPGAPSTNFAKSYLLFSLEPPFILGLPSAFTHLTARGQWPLPIFTLRSRGQSCPASNGKLPFYQGPIPQIFWRVYLLPCLMEPPSTLCVILGQGQTVFPLDQGPRSTSARPCFPPPLHNQTSTRGHHLAPLIYLCTYCLLTLH